MWGPSGPERFGIGFRMTRASEPHWLLLGANGMLGEAIRRVAAARGTRLTGWGRADFDLLGDSAAWPSLPRGVTHVINSAAWTDVDGAESAEASAHRVNGGAVADLSAWCARAGGGGEPMPTLVHVSTDYVFDGQGTEPYPVDHPCSPLNAYGRSKLAGELALRAGPAPFVCIRTAWLYAAWGNNFVRTMRRLMNSRDELQVVDDQLGRPTSASNLGDTLAGLADAGVTGFFHGTDGGQTTWYGLARHMADRLGYTGSLRPCSSAEFPRAAQRPAYSVLDLSRTEELLGPREPWTACVDRVLVELEREDPLGPASLVSSVSLRNPT